MWQRIQTLYLGISCFLLAALFFSHFATIVGPEGDVVYVNFYEKTGYLLMLIALLTGQILCLVTFKFRMLQVRVAVLVALMLLGFQIWLGVDIFRMRGQMSFSITAVFPLICAILDILAARAIFMDESMVQQSYRLRSASKRRRKLQKKNRHE